MEAILTIGGEVRFDTSADSDALRRIRETIGQLLQVKNVAVLMGTGASFHLGAPSIRKMDLPAIRSMANSAHLEITDVAAIVLRALITDDGVDLEQLLASLNNSLAYAASLNVEEVAIGGEQVGCDVLRDLRRIVNLSLAVACDLPNTDGITDPTHREDPWHAHREFFRRLLRSRRTDLPRVRVFTTNYDLAIVSHPGFDAVLIPWPSGSRGGDCRHGTSIEVHARVSSSSRRGGS